MKINKMHLTNFRCFENFTIEFEDDLTVVVAENGRGKSAILDAVAVVNCTPIVRQYDILKNNWGDFLCQREYQTKDIRQSLRSV